MENSQLYWAQPWEKYDKRYGQVKDGYTLHKSKEDLNAYIKENADRNSYPMGIPLQIPLEPGYRIKLNHAKNGIKVSKWKPSY